MNAGEAQRVIQQASAAPADRRSRGVACKECGLYGLCRVAGLEAKPEPVFEQVVSRREKVAAGAQLLSSGCVPGEIIAVHSGAFKASSRMANDREQVNEFILPGELIGLELLDGGPGGSVVEALEPSRVCRFRLSRLHLLAASMDAFRQQLIRALVQRNRIALKAPLMMGACKAEQRLALFLLGLSERFETHGFPAAEFRLPMSRGCIANYLGLAMETVSRVMKRFHSRGLIGLRSRQVSLVDIPRLREMAGLSR